MSKQDTPVDHRARFALGNKQFAILFTRWMDTNGWSHPTMVALAKAAMDGVGWLHSSQISGLRHAGIQSPGPKTFIAIERLNYYVHRYSTTRRLIPGTDSSNLYTEAYAITENGEPPSTGWWVEVFCGQRTPRDIDLSTTFFSEPEAEALSNSWGSLIRRLFRERDLDLIVELDRVLREHYPAGDADRLRSVRAVIENRQTWKPDELINELPAIRALTQRLGGPATEDDLLDTLRRSA